MNTLQFRQRALGAAIYYLGWVIFAFPWIVFFVIGYSGVISGWYGIAIWMVIMFVQLTKIAITEYTASREIDIKHLTPVKINDMGVFLNQLLLDLGGNPKLVLMFFDVCYRDLYPKVRKNKGRAVIIVSGRFNRLWISMPTVAKAMLAHEVGHIIQNDHDILLSFLANMRWQIKITPFFILFLITAFITAYFLESNAHGMYSQGIAAMLVGGNPSIAGDLLTNGQNGMVLSNFVASSGVIIILAMFFISVMARIYYHRAEAFCDVVAVKYAGKNALANALDLLSDSDCSLKVMGINISPSVNWRKQRLSRYAFNEAVY